MTDYFIIAGLFFIASALCERNADRLDKDLLKSRFLWGIGLINLIIAIIQGLFS